MGLVTNEFGLSPLPDPLDQEQATEEEVASYIIALQHVKAERNAVIPRLIARASNAKRDLDVAKSQIKFCEEATRAAQSILRSLRP